jgi:hypothetical protein
MGKRLLCREWITENMSRALLAIETGKEMLCRVVGGRERTNG